MVEEDKDGSWCVCSFFSQLLQGVDSVPHSSLLTKLSHLDLNENIVENYLTFRHQKVAVNGTTCDCTAVLSGVLQDLCYRSYFGPCLRQWPGILLCVSWNTTYSSCRRSSPLPIYLHFQWLLYEMTWLPLNISQWAIINTSKCKYMLIFRRNPPQWHYPHGYC